MKKNHYRACKNSNRNLPFPELGYMIKLHTLEHTKPTFQMKQIHNSEKQNQKHPYKKPTTGKIAFLHSSFYPLMVPHSKTSYYPYSV